MNLNFNNLKALIYYKLGKLSLNSFFWEKALILFKKSLQYAWYVNNKELEINIYEKLGLSFYYC
jgi:hypothetical protein